MALTQVGYGTAVTGTTSVTPGLPAGYTAVDGDIVGVAVVAKLYTATIATPSNWTKVLGGWGGVEVTRAPDVGPVVGAVYYREVSGGSITIPAFTQGSHTGACMIAQSFVLRGDLGIDTAAILAGGIGDTSSGTGLGGTVSSPAMPLAVGDVVIALGGATSDTPAFNSCSITQTGMTISSVTERGDTSTINGDDARMGLYSGDVTAGTSGSDQLGCTFTLSASSTGVVIVTRFRENAEAPPAGDYPVVRSATGDHVASTSESVVMNKPSGLAVDDYLVAMHTADADGSLAAMTAPAGFVLHAEQAGNASSNYPFLKIWKKVATSGDVAASTFTFPGDSGSDEAGNLIAIQAGTYDPADPIGPVTFTTQARIANQAITAPSIAKVDKALLVCVLSADTNNQTQSFSTPPTGMTEVADAGEAYSLVATFVENMDGTGTTGTRTATPTPASTANGWTSASFLINPAPSGAEETDEHTHFFHSVA